MELCKLSDERTNKITGFFPYPPVTNRHVAWVQKNMPVLICMAAMPDITQEHRERVTGHIAKLFMFYAAASDKSMPEAVFKQETARRGIIMEAFITDISPYPEWAVAAGIAAYRSGPEGKWAPKAPGQLIEFISAELGNARRALLAAERVAQADKMDRNIDRMTQDLDNLQGDPKAYAEKALSVMTNLARYCDIFADLVAKDLHTRCSRAWNDYRRMNPLPKKDAP